MTTTVPSAATGSDFAELSRAVREAGLLRRRHVHYAVTGALTVGALVAGWVAFALIGDSWWQLLTAVFLAVAFTHVSFLGHDAGHKQIFRGRKANEATGLALGGLVGLSYGWWIAKHNRHHANPNHEDGDPDLDLPALAFTKGQSTGRTGVLRWMARRQAFLFFPMLLLEGMNLHWSGIRAAWGAELKHRRIEQVMMVTHIGAYLAAVFLVLSPLTAIAFIAVHKGLWGFYMGCSFAPNHKGMPTLVDGHELDFLRKQVLTSRNVDGGPWVDVALGGLNHQIEHHLFPSMPRPNLRRARPIVRAFCAERGIDYAQCGLLRSYGIVLRHLHEVGAPLRAAKAE